MTVPPVSAFDPPPAPAVSADTEQIVRAAWAYYVEGLTQNEIAARLGVSRVRINRMLAQARERGLVQIRINTSLSIALEKAMEARFGLERAVIVPTPADPSRTGAAIAVAAGANLSARLQDGMSIGVGWGRTLRLSIGSIERKPVRDLSVVSLLGGLTRGSVMNAYETASRLADLFAAQCFYIAAPAFTDTPQTRDVLLRQSILQDAFKHARAVDVAFVSVGALGPQSTMAQLGLIQDEDIVSLKAAGAVGDICSHWIDAEGRIIDHPLNRRVLALSPDDLAPIETVILASGGPDKIDVVRAVLGKGIVNVLITDEQTARSVLGDGETTGPEGS